MPIIDANYSTLQLILQDVRELTRSLSDQQISDDRIKYWINTFLLYDFPEILRLKALRTTFEFYTTPYVDVYQSTFTDPNDPFYNFSNVYVTTHEPFYCAGFLGSFLQSRTSFFDLYPPIASLQLITYGDGITTQFSGFLTALQMNQTSGPNAASQLNVCAIRNQVLFDSIDANGNGLSMIDTPINALFGNLSVPNYPPTSTTVQDPINYINYVTGQFVVTFLSAPSLTPVAPGQGQNVNNQCVPVAMARPQTLLWFDNKITLRPVPDQPYKVSVEAFIRPAALILQTDQPKLAQWYQFIVYGAATKIFQMRGDSDSVERLAPEFKKQELLCLRTTIVQQSKQRVPTIYSQQFGIQYGLGFNNFGSTSF